MGPPGFPYSGGAPQLEECPLGRKVSVGGTLVEPLLGLDRVLLGPDSVQVTASDDEHRVGIAVVGGCQIGLEGRFVALELDLELAAVVHNIILLAVKAGVDIIIVPGEICTHQRVYPAGGVLAVVYDEWALGVSAYKHTITSQYNPRGQYTNDFDTMFGGFFMSPDENAVVFRLA